MSQRQYLQRTAQHRKTRTHIHASSGIRIHDPSVRAVKDRTCRLHGNLTFLNVGGAEFLLLISQIRFLSPGCKDN